MLPKKIYVPFQWKGLSFEIPLPSMTPLWIFLEVGNNKQKQKKYDVC